LRLLLGLLVVAGCSSPPEMSDWEREHALKQAPREADIAPPAFPSRGKLIEFPVAETGEIRFFVDGSTLAVDKEGIVRYVLVAQSAGGARNVTFEGLRCAAATHRVYATGQSDGTWAPARSSWQPVRNARRWQITLYREYFCPQKVPIRSADEGVRALQAGGHPFAKGLNAPNLGL
jgi:hypothetical protein